MKYKIKFIKLTELLGKVPTLYYVFLYVLMILLFATVYSLMPTSSFYHSTFKYEFTNLNQEYENFTYEIENTIKENFKEYYKKDIVEFDDWIVDINDFSIFGLSQLKHIPREGTNSISFKTWIPVKYQNNDTIIKEYISKKIIFNYKDKIWAVDHNKIFIKSVDVNLAFESKLGNTLKVSKLFPVRYEKYESDSHTVLTIPDELQIKIADLTRAELGFPKRAEGHWFRMLYLSSGIATSSVFGDIVPLTITSRLLVVFESILSIILISLFFNAIGYDIIKVIEKFKPLE